MSRSKVLWLLAAVNAVLIAALCWKVGGENAAYAQLPPRGEYVMLPARAVGQTDGLVYMIDTRNGLLTAFALNSNTRDLTAMQPINLARLFQAGPGVQPGRNPPRRP